MAWLRAVGGYVVVVVVTGVPSRAPGSQRLEAASRPGAFLDLRLTCTDDVPAASVAALVAETTAIWRDHIQLRWLPEPVPAEGVVVRVLVMPRAIPNGDSDVWAVAELVRSSGGGAAAIASSTGARRLVESARHSELLRQPDLFERRLGVVLGRAVAHEIGHFLLQTATHSSHGLMRARIDAREFADLRSRTFRLDDRAKAHLARLAARDTAEAFSYAR